MTNGHAQQAPNEDPNVASLSRPTARIIGGNTTEPGEFPFFVGLVSASNSNNVNGHFCGGSLIASNWVMTAAHCVTNDNNRGIVHSPASVDVVYGNVDLTNASRVNVERIVVHPDWAANGDEDLALLKLSRSINVTTIKLADPNHPNAVPGALATVMGWGVTSINSSSSQRFLLDVALPIIRFADCRDYWGGAINVTDHICAGVSQGGRDACFGDSGGPIVIKNSETDFVQIGVVSFGDSCAEPNTPAVFSRSDTHLDWIKQFVDLRATGNPNNGGQLTANFSYECNSLSCSFDAGSSNGGRNGLKSYWWNYGDGGTSTGRSAEHFFAAADDYRVTLMIVDNLGNVADVHQVLSLSTLVSDGNPIRDDYRGTLGGRQMTLLPSGNGFFAAAGEIRGRLDAPRGTDFELVLMKKSATTDRWRQVARSVGNGVVERIVYNAKAGQYLWSIKPNRGRGKYRLRTRHQ